MATWMKVGGFGLGLVALFGIALGVGALVGPTENAETPHHTATPHGANNAPMAHGPGGSTNTADGYTLTLADPIVTTDPAAALRFQITDRTGRPVTEYTTKHDKDLHMIVVRRDLAEYQHLHPTLGTDGTWSTSADLDRAGDYRVFADFVTGAGAPYTLGADLHVAGNYLPQPLPPPATEVTTGDYTVTMHGTPTPGRPTDLTFSITRAGQPVTDLQPYLGAYGHLVALRAADLGYLHVHPAGHPGDGTTRPGPDIGFTVTAPSSGDYRLFVEVRHEAQVHTAGFTVAIDDNPDAEHATPAPAEHGHGH